MGCSHFIVGRNHAGVGDFYKDEDCRRWFDELGDIGVVPVFFDAVGYDEHRRRYATDSSSGEFLKTISGTQVRQTLKEKRALPEWFMRDLIQQMLRVELSAERPVFHE